LEICAFDSNYVQLFRAEKMLISLVLNENANFFGIKLRKPLKTLIIS
jgi:hypothetical protein